MERSRSRSRSVRGVFGNPCIFAMFCASGIVAFVSILIVMASGFIRSNSNGFKANPTPYKSVAELNHVAFIVAFMGSCLSVCVSISCMCIFGKFSYKTSGYNDNNDNNTVKIIPMNNKNNNKNMWGDSAVETAGEDLGGKAHILVRLLTSLRNDKNATTSSNQTVNRCIHILSSNPNLWNADRNTIERALKKDTQENHVTSDSQTGVWLRGILSATPDWLDNDDSDEDEYEDEILDVNENTTGSTGEEKNQQPKERRRSSFRGRVHKLIVSKRLAGPFENIPEDHALIEMMVRQYLFSYFVC